jgi:hypothetical protein
VCITLLSILEINLEKDKCVINGMQVGDMVVLKFISVLPQKLLFTMISVSSVFLVAESALK